MATTVFLQRDSLGHLVPTDEGTKEWLAKLPRGEVVKGTMVRPRNARFHAKLFACAGLIANNMGGSLNARQVIAGYQAFADLGDRFKGKHGEVFVPKSIAFDAMSQDAFDELYDGFVKWVCSNVIPGLSAQDLNAEVEAELRQF